MTEHIDFDRLKWLEFQKIRLEHECKLLQQSEDYVVELSKLGLRSLILTNGGALIGFATYLSSTSTEMIQYSTLSILAFSVGLILALLATLSAYRTQLRFAEATQLELGNLLRILQGDSSTNKNYDQNIDRVIKANNRLVSWGTSFSIFSGSSFLLGVFLLCLSAFIPT